MYNKEMKTIRVLIIDDSAFSRQTIKRMIEKVPDIEVVGIATDGQDGMAKILRLKPNLVTLDIEMPKMDGFTLLRWIMEKNPMPVIMVSSYGDSPTVFKALELGAIDFVVKPTKRASKELEEIEDDLLKKISGLTSLRMEKLKKGLSLLGRKGVVNDFQPIGDEKIEIVAIGASTGGPNAIQTVLTRLPGDLPVAMVISQHMPRGFTRQFADRIDKISPLKVKESERGESLEKGKVLICPGGHHMIVERLGKNTFVNIKEPSTNDKYIPSVDIMMKSTAEVYGPRTLGVVLTGMGSDGKAGMMEIKNSGGFTIAESEESAIVFGMPKEVIASGAADKVSSLEDIHEEILKRLKKGNYA